MDREIPSWTPKGDKTGRQANHGTTARQSGSDTPTPPMPPTKPRRSVRGDDDDDVPTPLLKSATINGIVAAMSPSPTPSQMDSPSRSPTPETKGRWEIGPWSIGEFLGEGTSGVVRLGTHRVSGEVVAVKIIAKTNAHVSQAGSLANLELREKTRPAARAVNQTRRIPLGIEREVAILKLIRHPNVIQLVDIWENKTALYVITEYAEKGDMYSFVNWNGPVRESEALSYFRQIMSAVESIHSLNLCHRDLKLDNILLGPDGQIKIADFGMAALHQFPEHRLATACGSPHYAAPEIHSRGFYDGRMADVWSMGVILFGLLASHLPFDEDDLTLVAEKAKVADYDLPPWFSPESEDFLNIVLVVDPTQRLSIAEMWGHPLVKKYEFLDDLHESHMQGPSGGRHANYPPILESSVDVQLLRQLQSIWHDYDEEDVLWKLRQDTPNDFKLFYWLLYQHRERQLEKYGADVMASEDDHHHLMPPNWSERYALCEFSRRARISQRNSTQVSVLNNSDGKTMDDPFYPSGNPQLSPPKPSRRKPVNSQFAIHQYKVGRSRAASIRTDTASIHGSVRSRTRHGPIPKPRSKRGVEFSLTRSRPGARAVSVRTASSDTSSRRGSVSSSSDTADEGPSYVPLKLNLPPRECSTIFEEDVLKATEEISSFCDQAFNNSSILEAETSRAGAESSPFLLDINPEPTVKKPLLDQRWFYGEPSDPTPYMNRPLPPTPRLSARAAEWVNKQPPPPSWEPFGGEHLFPNPINLEFTIAGASPDNRRVVSDPVVSAVPVESVASNDVSVSSLPEGDSQSTVVNEDSNSSSVAPPAQKARRKSAYVLFPPPDPRIRPAPLRPVSLPPVQNPPSRRASWFNLKKTKPQDLASRDFLPPLRPLPHPPTTTAAPIPTIRVVHSSPSRAPSPALQLPIKSDFLTARPCNVPAPLHIRKISPPAQGAAMPAPLNIKRKSSLPVQGTTAPAPLNIHRKVSLPEKDLPPRPLDLEGIRERRVASLILEKERLQRTEARSKEAAILEKELLRKDQARAKELEAAKPKRTTAAIKIPAWLKRTTKEAHMAEELSEIAKEGKARLAAQAAHIAAVTAAQTAEFAAEAFAAAGLPEQPKKESKRPALTFRWPKWYPQPVPEGKTVAMTDEVDNSDDYVTESDDDDELGADVPLTREAFVAARNKKLEKFHQYMGFSLPGPSSSSGLASSSAPSAAARRATGGQPAKPAPRPEKAPAAAALDREVEGKKSMWLARLLGVQSKPKLLCFGMSQARTLRMLEQQLEAWRAHGIEELAADFGRGRIWVTVAPQNALNLKPVSFAIEAFRMCETTDGVSTKVSIARFTLEKGSARSLAEAVKTIKAFFWDAGALVKDPELEHMMVTTLKKARM